MKKILQNKTAVLVSVVSFFLLSIFFLSCKKDMNETNTPPIQEQLPDLVSKVSSSVSGFVTDQNDAAVVGASVKLGSTSIMTDRYGYFEIKNVQVAKQAATVTVTYDGYFNSVKTYIAAEGKAAFFRIKLLQKTIAGTIDAANGGSVFLSNGMNISFPAAAIKDASSGAIYSGTVKVAAQYIDPTSAELRKIMPGDLRGIDDAGYIKGLTSYGMMAVELTGDAGQLLQIADGKKSTLTMPIPAAILSTAPSTIPLWYFNENNGLWKQEGVATKTGNGYVGEVSHFSFWNWDLPNVYSPFDCTLLNSSGQPVSFALIKISVVGADNATYGYSDQFGYVSGGVPQNAELLMEVLYEGACSNAVYSHNFSTTTSPLSLGNLLLPASATSTVTGNVTDCNGNAVTNGYFNYRKGAVAMNYRYDLDNTGAFTFVIPYCQDNSALDVYAVDLTGAQQSATINAQLTAGINSLGTLNACGLSTNQFMSYNVDGVDYYIDDNGLNHLSLNAQLDPYGNLDFLYVFTSTVPMTVNSALYFAFESESISYTQPYGKLVTLDSHQFGPQANPDIPIPMAVSFPNPVLVYITEFGNVGEYVSGHFSGHGLGWDIPYTPYDFSCNFRIKRGP